MFAVTKYTAVQRRGYTLIELLIGISILLMLSSIAYASFRGLDGRLRLEAAASDVLRTIEEAQTKTVSATDDTSYGVHFATGQYTMFPGTTYDSANVENKTYSLPSGITITQINLGGPVDVVFERVRGTASASGTIVLATTSSPAVTRTVSVYEQSPAELSRTSTVANTRVVDTRHVHLTLPASIQAATTMRLRFQDSPAADVISDIAIASYLSADQSSFDWSGTISVNGANQTMRIHTHTLTPTQTVLSVHRDRRLNTKAVTISVDGQSMALYAADGTLTTYPAGGTAVVQ